MKRILLTLLAIGLVAANYAAAWATMAAKACPGKCPFCP